MQRWHRMTRFTFERESWWLVAVYWLLPLVAMVLVFGVPAVARLF